MEEQVAMHPWVSDLFSLAIIITAGLIGSIIAKKIKVPDIVLFLVIGVLLGPSFGHLISGGQFNGLLNILPSSYINQFILVIAACYLLFDGGASVKFAVLKKVWITIVVISIVGVVVTGAITSVGGLLLGIPLWTAILIGAITASTDPATLVPIFKQVPIRDKVSQTVMSESAFNDAMGAIATGTVVAIILAMGSGNASEMAKATDPGAALGTLGWKAGMGLLVGAIIGFVVINLKAHSKIGIFKGYEPFVLLLGIIFSFVIAEQFLQASGFMAVFVFGIMVGNRESFKIKMEHEHEEKMEHAIGSTAFFLRTCIFILLGSQVSFDSLAQYWWQGLLLLLIFMFIARPVTVFVCAGPDRRAKWTLKELIFMSWTRETGVIPAALVGMYAANSLIPNMQMVTSITFIFILGTILIQAPTTAPLAKKLGLLKSQESA